MPEFRTLADPAITRDAGAYREAVQEFSEMLESAIDTQLGILARNGISIRSHAGREFHSLPVDDWRLRTAKARAEAIDDVMTIAQKCIAAIVSAKEGK